MLFTIPLRGNVLNYYKQTKGRDTESGSLFDPFNSINKAFIALKEIIRLKPNKLTREGITKEEDYVRTSRETQDLLKSEFKEINFQKTFDQLRIDIPDSSERPQLERRAEAAALLYTYAKERYKNIEKLDVKDQQQTLQNINLALRMYHQLLYTNQSFNDIYSKLVKKSGYSFTRGSFKTFSNSLLEKICHQIEDFNIESSAINLIEYPQSWRMLKDTEQRDFAISKVHSDNHPFLGNIQETVTSKEFENNMLKKAGEIALAEHVSQSGGTHQELREQDKKDYKELQKEREQEIEELNDYTKEYYHAFMTQVSEVYTACHGISSGHLKDEKETKLGKASDLIDLVKDQISFFPGAGMILGALGTTLKVANEYQKSKEAEAISHFFSGPVAMDNFLHPLALKLAKEQEPLLKYMHERKSQPVNIYGKIKEKFKGKGGPEILATQHAANFLDAILQKQLRPNPTKKDINSAAQLVTKGEISLAPSSTSGRYPRFLETMRGTETAPVDLSTVVRPDYIPKNRNSSNT